MANTISQLHGKYYTQASSGNVWHASITTASAIPIFATNMTPNFGFFNPAGNNKAIVLINCVIGFVAGTSVASTIGYAFLNPAGSAMAGTAAPISTFTAGPAMRGGIVGQTYGGSVQFASSMTVGGVVSAWTTYKWSNFSTGVITATSTAAAFTMEEDFEGSIIIPPNTAFAPMSQPAMASTMQVSMSFYEIPWPILQ